MHCVPLWKDTFDTLYWYRVSTHQKHTTNANVHTLQTHPICFVFYTYYKYSYEFQAWESHFSHRKKLLLKSKTNLGKCYHTNLGYENRVTPGKKSERWWAGRRRRDASKIRCRSSINYISFSWYNFYFWLSSLSLQCNTMAILLLLSTVEASAFGKQMLKVFSPEERRHF